VFVGESKIVPAPGEDERLKARAGLGERYGTTRHDERIPEVAARFGIEDRKEVG
jgi:hypothetical protein